MTLSRQLILLVVILLALIFLGTFIVSVQNTRDYMEAQLESHAQDAATSLGLSISPHLAERDLATVTSMTDAIFDRGYYRLVRVETMKGKPLLNRSLPVRIEGVPQWFINTFHLETPEGESVVMEGWTQAGRVRIKSHPGYAYVQLWDNVHDTFWWFLACALFVLLIAMALLRWVLQPLKDVEWQANSICNREFPILKKLPRTRDLRRIVEAMNRMSGKVQRMLAELEKLAGSLKEQAHHHPVTGLVNKRYFMSFLEDRIHSLEHFSRGALCLIELKGFKTFNDAKGYQAGDALLRVMADLLRKVAENEPRSIPAHLAGADFALLVEDCSMEQARLLGERISAALADLYGAGRAASPDVGHVGIAWFDGRQTTSELLAQADMALRTAQSVGANCWDLSTPESLGKEVIRSAGAWHDFLVTALAEDRVRLQIQPVVTCPGRELLHKEVLVRIAERTEEGTESLLSAGLFMPEAESMGLTAEIDQAVIRLVLRRLGADEKEEEQLSVNLSPASLHTEGFMDWLEQILSEHLDEAGRMILELPEYGAATMLDEVRDLIERVSRFGCRFALDHYGTGASSFAYLHSLKVNYLKVDGSYLRTLVDNKDHQFYIYALTEIAHGLDIEVIAESIESEAVWNLLPSLHIDGAQGYFIGRPET